MSEPQPTTTIVVMKGLKKEDMPDLKGMYELAIMQLAAQEVVSFFHEGKQLFVARDRHCLRDPGAIRLLGGSYKITDIRENGIVVGEGSLPPPTKEMLRELYEL